MNLQEAVTGIEQHLRQFADSAAQRIEQELPVIAGMAEKAASNPVIDAALNAVHLGAVPELLAVFADAITKADTALGASKAAGAAEAQAAAAAAAVPVPDPAPPAA